MCWPTSAAAASSGPRGTRPGSARTAQVVYDDFAAVAKDLIARKITSPRRLGIEGGSNGGLLMGVEFDQHPELWNAVVIQVPLLDMIRISKIAAGASWEGEYGERRSDPGGPGVLGEDLALPEPAGRARAIPSRSSSPPPRTTASARSTPASSRRGWRNMACPSSITRTPRAATPPAPTCRQVAHTSALEMVYLTRKLMDDEAPPSR